MPGKGAGGRGSLRLLPGKALFLRREAQTFHPEKPPAAVGVCAPLPGKPYSSVERRKPFTGKSARSQCEFAPPSRESLITPLRGANRLPGKGAAAVGVCASFPGKPYFSVEKRKPFTRKSAGGRGSLRPIPGKALFLRRGAQTLHPEKPPAAVGVCAPLPGKPYSSVEGRKPFAGKRRRRLREFAPHSRESLILPLRGANLSPGKAPAAAGVCASLPGKPYSSVEGRKPFTREEPPGGGVSLRLTPGKALFFRRGAQTLHPGRAPAAGGSLRLTPGKALFFR